MKFILATLGLATVSCVKLERWGYDKEHPHPGFQATWDGFEGNWEYKRDIPDHFQGAGSGDDQFMNSMIKNYAVEGATDDAYPTGEFYFTHLTAWMAAREVVETHLGLTGQAREDYLDKYFEKTWKHFDTADDGKIEPSRMGGFFRFLCGNMQITLH
mmetsp:Transcript_32419/g.49590  ORF Transcript_32419/g.49590 Transcript_32419/m.49590 type:complete len:157 (-) Transcript_32419:59-529(-)|eukprot:CAMPEP_0170482266 /NCGR_PEP_ID=MMETSP0208-20121228/2365_1 /TAXON_ID=197538 /ORGANISM="Strombidium inclinatum, Strain S3" /LENGTH=156 /DNA_ID=CAMNT_0010755091 /DNA_START=12 /DNA_END=482 /DNA_ORIENTATION=+